MNKMMGALLGGAMLMGALALPTTTLAADKSKMVIQVSDSNPATWNLALNNAKNVQNDMGKDNVELEIVAYGPGIGMLKADSEVANRVSEAVEAGVQVVACENTMRGQKLTKADMNAKIGYVQAGVVEILQRQKQGYAYLRP
jgi:intracellular sulfur oxidation DsrE/DsrF family protein